MRFWENRIPYKRGSRSQAERNGGRKWRVDIYIAESGLITASGWKVVLLPEYFSVRTGNPVHVCPNLADYDCFEDFRKKMGYLR